MKRILIVMAALLALAVVGVSAVLAAVSTDQANYGFGDTVTITGDGMAAGETVSVDILAPDGVNAQHHEVLADDNGNFLDTYVVPEDAPGGDYTVVATGLTSGAVFTTTFDPNGCNGGPIPGAGDPCHVKQSSLDTRQGDCTSTGGTITAWHFILANYTGTTPASINVTWDTPKKVKVQLDKVNGANASYRTSLNAGDLVTDATVVTTGLTGNMQFNLSGVTCETGATPTPRPPECATETNTDIVFHGGTKAGHSTGPSVTMGAQVNDTATVKAPGCPKGPPRGGKVTVQLYDGKGCVTPKGNAESFPPQGVKTSNNGPLHVGAISYQAAYSGFVDPVGGTTYSRSLSECENLQVLSSITSFHYHTVAGGAKEYNCTIETKALGNCNEAKTTVGTPNKFLVHVTVNNDTGTKIKEFVQGGLAANSSVSICFVSLTGSTSSKCSSTNASITSPTCGTAVIKRSSGRTSGGQTGNVVTWYDGSNFATVNSSKGFSMQNGDTCDLVITLTKTYTSTGQQPVTSSWSENQTWTNPKDNTSLQMKSPYTDRLSIIVN